ncbi:DUF554 domain-containing protein [Xylanibacillus composti]|uniref:Membrane protein n=1 Tax=Xylanibacillus composti TaxID=1572762 RepID=A0A8J4H1F6_9BACL|nr:DUF554 domain-containing protein [Xylanibacillus composti]MDT9723946.1 DUF554 domain-containing protein [Xylanibacillus composti]GIQ67825.1 membrane protein [Xylanibacillus composti]
MALWGTIVNTAAIILGGLLGSLLPRVSEGVRRTVIQGLGLALMVLGVTMALETANILIVIASLVLGGLMGEWMKLEDRLHRLGAWLEQTVQRFTRTKTGEGKGSIAEGFVTATLVYCIGAMAILGALDGGLRQDHTILYTKSMLDGVSAVIFASTLGIGVIFSSIPVFLYQGSIALAASFIYLFVSETQMLGLIAEVTAVGGVLIVGIGLNILEIKKINVANLLPSLLIAIVLVSAVPYWNG